MRLRRFAPCLVPAGGSHRRGRPRRPRPAGRPSRDRPPLRLRQRHGGRARSPPGGRTPGDRRHRTRSRTPVAGLSTAVGLPPPGRASELVAGSKQKLRGLVDDVLEVARMGAQVAAVDTEERETSAMARRASETTAPVTRPTYSPHSTPPHRLPNGRHRPGPDRRNRPRPPGGLPPDLPQPRGQGRGGEPRKPLSPPALPHPKAAGSI